MKWDNVYYSIQYDIGQNDTISIISYDNNRLSQSALNNEFLTKACHEWKERLVGGDVEVEEF